MVDPVYDSLKHGSRQGFNVDGAARLEITPTEL
jgi:hypothetical protein